MRNKWKRFSIPFHLSHSLSFSLILSFHCPSSDEVLVTFSLLITFEPGGHFASEIYLKTFQPRFSLFLFFPLNVYIHFFPLLFIPPSTLHFTLFSFFSFFSFFYFFFFCFFCFFFFFYVYLYMCTCVRVCIDRCIFGCWGGGGGGGGGGGRGRGMYPMRNKKLGTRTLKLHISRITRQLKWPRPL